MAAVGLPAKPSKIVRPSASGIEYLGLQLDGVRGDFGLAVPKLQRLVLATRQLIAHGYATGRQLARVVGRWTWAMLVRRPALAVFSAVYRFVAVAGPRRFQLWPSLCANCRRQRIWHRCCSFHSAPRISRASLLWMRPNSGRVLSPFAVRHRPLSFACPLLPAICPGRRCPLTCHLSSLARSAAGRASSLRRGGFPASTSPRSRCARCSLACGGPSPIHRRSARGWSCCRTHRWRSVL